MNNILKFSIISLLIITIIVLIPMYIMYNFYTSSNSNNDASNYNSNYTLEELIETDQNTMQNIKNMNNTSVVSDSYNQTKFISAFILSLAMIYGFLLVLGIYMIKKNKKLIGASFVFCSIFSPILDVVILYIAYYNF